MEGLERLEDFYVGTHLRDNIASLRDSTFTASDVDVDVGRNRWYSRPKATIIVSHSCGETSCLLTMSWSGWAYREGTRKTGCRLFLLAGLFRFNWVALQGAVMGGVVSTIPLAHHSSQWSPTASTYNPIQAYKTTRAVSSTMTSHGLRRQAIPVQDWGSAGHWSFGFPKGVEY